MRASTPACLPACLPDPCAAAATCRHEEYQVTTFSNDIAVLELNTSAVHGQPIAHILQPGGFNFTEGHLLTAVGWGYTG